MWFGSVWGAWAGSYFCLRALSRCSLGFSGFVCLFGGFLVAGGPQIFYFCGDFLRWWGVQNDPNPRNRPHHARSRRSQKIRSHPPQTRLRNRPPMQAAGNRLPTNSPTATPSQRETNLPETHHRLALVTRQPKSRLSRAEQSTPRRKPDTHAVPKPCA